MPFSQFKNASVCLGSCAFRMCCLVVCVCVLQVPLRQTCLLLLTQRNIVVVVVVVIAVAVSGVAYYCSMWHNNIDTELGRGRI